MKIQYLQYIYVILEDYLESLLPVGHKTDLVRTAMRAATLTSGKRIRPLLLLLAASDMGCDIKLNGILDLACAVEMVHTASLILDDIPSMDNAIMRRSLPTIHYEFGENIAILSAIGLLSRAFEVIAIAPDIIDVKKSEVIAELSSAIGVDGLIKGQFQDLYNNMHNHNSESIEMTNALKTSVLFRVSLQIAAIIANASLTVRDNLIHFAQNFGQAFQLLDDLTDKYDYTCKDCDEDKSKSTLVEILGVDEALNRLQDHLIKADAYLANICQFGISTRLYMKFLFNEQLALLELN